MIAPQTLRLATHVPLLCAALVFGSMSASVLAAETQKSSEHETTEHESTEHVEIEAPEGGKTPSNTNENAAVNGHEATHETKHAEKAGKEEEEEKVPKGALLKQTLHPAENYQGRTPVDLKHGLPFNNGTYGLPNDEYESWKTSANIVPNVSEKTYPFDRKDDFVSGVRESVQFIETAIWSWGRVSPDTKPEAADYAKASIGTMKPLLAKLEDAVSAADSSGKSDWDRKQEDARRVLIEARTTYWQLHKNTHR